MIILITGSQGFVGLQLVSRLRDEGHNVTGFDDFSSASIFAKNEGCIRGGLPLDVGILEGMRVRP